MFLPPHDQPAHVVLVHVGHDHRINLIKPQTKPGEGLRQVAGLPDRARCTGINQDAALAIIDKILIKQKPHSAWPGDELGGSRLFYLGRVTPGKKL